MLLVLTLLLCCPQNKKKTQSLAACTFCFWHFAAIFAKCAQHSHTNTYAKQTKDETKCKTHTGIIEFYYIVWRGTTTRAAGAKEKGRKAGRGE